MPRALRWTKKTDELVRYKAFRCRPGFQSELGQWLESSPRFQTFLTVHQNKVRKKLTVSDDEETRLDVRSELLIAYLLLGRHRFEVQFEAYGARNVGPDLGVSFRVNQRFNLEITRLRAASEPGTSRNANVLAGKLRQLSSDTANAVVISTRNLPLTEADLAEAARLLKSHADQKDDDFFARRGFLNARDFYARFRHLGGIFAVDETTAPLSASYWLNREARLALPSEAVAAFIARIGDTSQPLAAAPRSADQPPSS